jgi:hypothetical protein
MDMQTPKGRPYLGDLWSDNMKASFRHLREINERANRKKYIMRRTRALIASA